MGAGGYRVEMLENDTWFPLATLEGVSTTYHVTNLTPSTAVSGDLAGELRALRAAIEALAGPVEGQRDHPLGRRGDGSDGDRLGAALLSLRELITESVGVTLRQIERLQEAQEETRARLHQLSEDLFRRDEQAQLLMEATADIAARCEQLASRAEINDPLLVLAPPPLARKKSH